MKSLNRMILISLLIILPLNTVQASSISLCEPSGVVFGFFNGVQTTDVEALRALNDLKTIHGESNADGEAIQYELLYNFYNHHSKT